MDFRNFCFAFHGFVFPDSFGEHEFQNFSEMGGVIFSNEFARFDLLFVQNIFAQNLFDGFGEVSWFLLGNFHDDAVQIFISEWGFDEITHFQIFQLAGVSEGGGGLRENYFWKKHRLKVKS